MPFSPPRICDFGAAAARDMDDMARMRALGFNFASFDFATADDVTIIGKRPAGLDLAANIAWPEMPAGDPFVTAHSDWFALRHAPPSAGIVDPRCLPRPNGSVTALYRRAPRAFDRLWQERLAELAAADVRAFRFRTPLGFEADALRGLIARLRVLAPKALFIADIAGLTRAQLAGLGGCGFDFCLSSLPWWDFRSPALVEEYADAAAAGAMLSRVDADYGLGPASLREREARLAIAAIAGSGLWMPLRFWKDCDERGRLEERLRAIHAFMASEPILAERGALLSRGGILLRLPLADERSARTALAAIVNRDNLAAQPPPPMLEDWQFSPAIAQPGEAALAPGEVRLLRAARRPPIRAREPALDTGAPRLVIDNVTPAIAGGFAVKRIVGDMLVVEADIFADGHPLLAAALVHGDERIAMHPLENDRWRGAFVLDRVGDHSFIIEAWIDRYGGFARDLAAKRDAGQDIAPDLREGAAMVRDALGVSAPDTAILLAPETIEAMQRVQARHFLVRSRAFPVTADRAGALFASWYELFARSQSGDAARHGTFADVIARLPAIRAMGFDVLYLPPIHPIGHTNRKGRDNALIAAPGDPGSVYAIGAAEGGHDAIHPELGTLEDFRALVGAARAQGLEIALDFAVQCSPDHPWLKQHPGWFDWRADGTIKFAENPPKKYEDIVNVDFYAPDAVPALWYALRDIVRFWAREGVRIFRVDNPHTKPFAFWQWLIAGIRARDPDIIFLAEAFTRPKIMYHLAKLGFTQSYTYFTWRDTKDALTQYLSELNAAPVRDFFRPHFFANTPDINPWFLQRSGRPGFLIRAALAATLSGLWGIYSGFELCEAEALPEREEYRDSEKYALKPRDWNAPGNIVAEIAALNRLRKAYPALQSHLGLTFYNAFNPNILYYGKQAPGETGRILAAVSLDPGGAQDCDFEIPLWEWGLPDSGALLAEDLLSGRHFVWHGKIQHLHLTPEAPYRIWHVCPAEDQP